MDWVIYICILMLLHLFRVIKHEDCTVVIIVVVFFEKHIFFLHIYNFVNDNGWFSINALVVLYAPDTIKSSSFAKPSVNTILLAANVFTPANYPSERRTMPVVGLSDVQIGINEPDFPPATGNAREPRQTLIRQHR